MICFVASSFAFAAADAFVLVEDHHIVRALLVAAAIGSAASERNDNKPASSRREEASPVNVLSHLGLPSDEERGFASAQNHSR